MSCHYRYLREFRGPLLEVPCAVCGGRASNLIGIDNGFRVVRCETPGCRFVFVNPRPTEEQLRTLYDEYYPDGSAVPDIWQREMRSIFRECRDLILGHGPAGEVLDIGCSFGHLLEELEAAGWTGTGVEPAASAIRLARQRTGSRIIEGTFESADLPPGSFDAVIALYVLEHVSDPRRFMAGIFHVLREGGLAIVRIPYTAPLIPLNRLLGRSLMHAPMHLNDFSPQSLTRLALELGFRRVETRIGALRHSSDRLEHAGALLLGGFGRLLERISRRRILFPWAGARTYCLWR